MVVKYYSCSLLKPLYVLARSFGYLVLNSVGGSKLYCLQLFVVLVRVKLSFYGILLVCSYCKRLCIYYQWLFSHCKRLFSFYLGLYSYSNGYIVVVCGYVVTVKGCIPTTNSYIVILCGYVVTVKGYLVTTKSCLVSSGWVVTTNGIVLAINYYLVVVMALYSITKGGLYLLTCRLLGQTIFVHFINGQVCLVKSVFLLQAVFCALCQWSGLFCQIYLFGFN